MDDGFIYFGWPFSVYFSGGYAGGSAIAWTGVIGNVAVALCTARVATAVVDKFLIGRGLSFTKVCRRSHLKSGFGEGLSASRKQS
jgi:hypothetical protein